MHTPISLPEAAILLVSTKDLVVLDYARASVSRSLDKGNARSGNENVHTLPINTSTYHMEQKILSLILYIYKSIQLVYFCENLKTSFLEF